MLEHRNRFRRTPLAAAVLLACSPLLPAATIAVNDASQNSVVGKCTLLDAVTALNTASPVHACAAGDGNNDTIDFSFFTAPTAITFSVLPADGVSALPLTKAARFSAPLDASGNPLVTVSRSTVSGTPTFRLIATASDLRIDGLALSGGSSPDKGGAVFADQYANVSVANSIISNSYAVLSGGGIAVDCGNLTLTNSRISGNSAHVHGGGIYTADDHYHSGSTTCSGTVTLSASTLSGNTALTGNGGGAYLFKGYFAADRSVIDSNTATLGNGGGVFVLLNATLTRSTLSNNSAHGNGGGAEAGGNIKTIASTVSGNTAASLGGGVFSKYTAAIDSTFTGNVAGSGGAISALVVKLTFSTITGNSAGKGAGIYFSAGGNTPSGSAVASIVQDNLLGSDVTSDNGTGSVTGNNSIIGSSNVPLPADTRDCDAKLGALADSGGPTRTIALGAGSCAIDTGPLSPPAAIPSDQRGAVYARRVGAATDVGAFEVQGNDRIFYDGFEP